MINATLLSKMLDGAPIMVIEYSDNKVDYILLRAYKTYNPSNHIHETVIDRGIRVTSIMAQPLDSQSIDQVKTKIMDLPEISLTLSAGHKFFIVKNLQL